MDFEQYERFKTYCNILGISTFAEVEKIQKKYNADTNEKLLEALEKEIKCRQ